jgi:hypothetical protein
MSDEINIKDIRVSPEQIAAWQASQVEKPKQTDQAKAGKMKCSEQFKQKFYKFPAEVIDALITANYAPAWIVAAAISQQWYDTFGGNPVKLTSRNLKKSYGVSRGQKARSLKILEDSKKYVVERNRGKNPSAEMTWEPRKAPNQY